MGALGQTNEHLNDRFKTHLSDPRESLKISTVPDYRLHLACSCPQARGGRGVFQPLNQWIQAALIVWATRGKGTLMDAFPAREAGEGSASDDQARGDQSSAG